MPILYPLKPLARLALWEAYNRLCYYCKESLGFRSMEIDHVIPVDRAATTEVWNDTCRQLGLPRDFEIDGLDNLVPACRTCNRDKLNNTFLPGRLTIDLSAIKLRRIEVEKRFDTLSRKDHGQRALAAMAVAISEGTMSLTDLRAFERSYLNDRGVFLTRLGGLFAHESLVDVDRADIEALLDRPIGDDVMDLNGLTLIGPDGEERKVTTLRAYRDAKALGFFAATSYTMSMQTLYFERPLVLLSVIAAAQYPEKSHMESPRLGMCDLARLPATLLFVTEEISDSVFQGQRAALEGKTIHDLISNGEATVRSVSSQHLQIEHARNFTFLLELMRADTNADGYEELVLHRGGGPVDGTYRTAHIMALSIREPAGTFVEVSLL
nr:HNH endonuclease signature motif containing protein [Pseudolysobacter antarcticus]